MHLENGDASYACTADAIARWPETPTAVTARLSGRDIRMLAPHDFDDLLGLLVRPTPHILATGRSDLYRARVTAKGWRNRWPRLCILDPAALP